MTDRELSLQVTATPLVIAIVGASNSGKTRIAARLVHDLTARGLRVASIKHCPHGHDINNGSTDSARLFSAGALVSVAASSDRMTAITRLGVDTPLDEIVDTLPRDIDVVVAEGFKRSSAAKIMVLGGTDRVDRPSNIVAVVGDVDFDLDVPRFHPNDSQGVTEFICLNSKFFTRPEKRVRLVVDGREITLNRFPMEALSGMVMGFVRSLNGIPDDAEMIEIKLRPGSN